MGKQKIHYTDIAAINAYSKGEVPTEVQKPVYISAGRILCFAEDTDNHQWIHKPHRHTPDDPYGGQIAHGLLLLSLIPGILKHDELEIVGERACVIRGLDRVRFTNPVYPGWLVYLRWKNLKAYAAPSGKGTVVEREISLCTKPTDLTVETVLTCTLKQQYI